MHGSNAVLLHGGKIGKQRCEASFPKLPVAARRCAISSLETDKDSPPTVGWRTELLTLELGSKYLVSSRHVRGRVVDQTGTLSSADIAALARSCRCGLILELATKTKSAPEGGLRRGTSRSAIMRRCKRCRNGINRRRSTRCPALSDVVRDRGVQPASQGCR
jgi:hypothetical protein